MPCITKEKCIEIILNKFPGFQMHWEQHCKNYGGIGLCMDLSAFSFYTMSLLKKNTTSERKELQEIFDHIEHLLNFGDKDVQDAAATCFLENISNRTPSIPASSFVPFLGKESKAYLKAWDEFIGLKTEGLWDV